MANIKKVSVVTFSSTDQDFDQKLQQHIQAQYDQSHHAKIELVATQDGVTVCTTLPDVQGTEQAKTLPLPKGTKKAMRALIKTLDDQDFRDNFKGKRLIDFLTEKYIVSVIED
jgi:hypothetical protein